MISMHEIRLIPMMVLESASSTVVKNQKALGVKEQPVCLVQNPEGLANRPSPHRFHFEAAHVAD